LQIDYFCKKQIHPTMTEDLKKNWKSVLLVVLAIWALIATTFALSNERAYKQERAENNLNMTRASKQLSITQKNQKRVEQLLYKAIDLQNKYYQLLNKVYKQQPQDEESKQKLAQSYSDYAWYLIMNKKFKAAISYAKKGMSLDSVQLSCKRNLLLADLMSGEIEEAKKLYLQYKDKKDKKATFKEIIRGDLITLENEDITSPAVDEFYKFLKANK